MSSKLDQYRQWRDEVRRAADGRWLEILVALAPELSHAADKKPHHVPCPSAAHTTASGKASKDGFRFFKDAHRTGGGCCNTCGARHDGFEMLMWLNGWRFRDALEAVAGYLGLSQGTMPEPNKPVPVQTPQRSMVTDEELSAYRGKIQRLWDLGEPVNETAAEPARLYFARRGLRHVRDGVSPSLRYVDRLTYLDKDTGEMIKTPGVIAQVTDIQGHMTGLHRLYLTDDGMKFRSDCKRLVAIPEGMTLSGSAVQLSDIASSDQVGITEGIETGLACQQAVRVPVMAAVSAAMMKAVQLPRHITTVFIFADKDVSGAGYEAAEALVKRLREEGRKAIALLPSMPIPEGAKGVDWLDVFNQRGVEAFPDLARYKALLDQRASA